MLPIFFLSLLLLVIAFGFNKFLREDLVSKLPSPSKLPIVRHGHHFSGRSPTEIFKLLEKFFNQLGKIWHFGLLNFNIIFIKDVKIVEEILTSQKLIEKSPSYDFFHKWLGLGLLTSTGEKWYKMRKIITPAFHFQILEQMVEVMDRNGQIFIEKISKFDGQEIDVFPLISLLALDIICGKHSINDKQKLLIAQIY
jgi:cytochrome P450